MTDIFESMAEDPGFPEEIIGLEYFFVPPERQTKLDLALRALQADAHLEFLLTVFAVTINDRPLNPWAPPARDVLRKLLQALDAEHAELMLYESPYNDLGVGRRDDSEDRITWWDFDIAEQLCQFRDLRSVRAFLEYGSGTATGRPAADAQAMHDLLLQGLVGDSKSYGIWGCANVQTAGAPEPSEACGPDGGVWPAEDVSPWFKGVFWDDLLLVLNPMESTLSILAITSS
ncbi:MAG: hypothetical protein ACO1SX_15960 [Actinomycetota bacterium]